MRLSERFSSRLLASQIDGVLTRPSLFPGRDSINLTTLHAGRPREIAQFTLVAKNFLYVVFLTKANTGIWSKSYYVLYLLGVGINS